MTSHNDTITEGLLWPVTVKVNLEINSLLRLFANEYQHININLLVKCFIIHKLHKLCIYQQIDFQTINEIDSKLRTYSSAKTINGMEMHPIIGSVF